MANQVRRLATYEDIINAPPNMVAEVLNGQLHLHPRPAAPHSAAASALGDELGPPFKRGRGGPGGWILLFEPELHLGPDIVVPDLGGWRRARMAVIPHTAFLTLAPDWVAEVLSPSTEKVDRTEKLEIYARERVPWVWLVNPRQRTLEILNLASDGRWVLQGTYHDDVKIRAEPFAAIEFDLSALWADVEPFPP